MKARELPDSSNVKQTEIKVRQFHFSRQTCVTHPGRSKWSTSITRIFATFFQWLGIPPPSLLKEREREIKREKLIVREK